jgi:quercetin dioxygenase-like cupin family protein
MDHTGAQFSDARSGAPMPDLKAIKFDQIEKEQLNGEITRQMLSGQDCTFAQILIKKGGVVPRHSHRSEQVSLIVSGALKFVFDDGDEVTLHAGEFFIIPARLPHSAVAMEDTVDFDFFAPRREDWINKTDAYFRQGAEKE